MKNIVLFTTLVGFVMLSPLWAARRQNAAPTFEASGTRINPVVLTVGATTSVSPYSTVDFGPMDDAQRRNFRKLTIGPAPFDLHVSTFEITTSSIGVTDSFFVISSNTVRELTNPATIYFLRNPHTNTGVVRGFVDIQE